MTLRSPAWLQNGASYSASTDRLTAITPLYDLPGVVGPNHMNVVPTAPASMSVTITGGNAIVGDPSGGSGFYSVFNDGNAVVTCAQANPSNPRIDRIALAIRDSDIAGTSDEAVFQVIQGTPASTPTIPPLPANAISLGSVTVGSGVSSLSSNVIDGRHAVRDKAILRRVMAGPIVPVANMAEGSHLISRLGRGNVSAANPLVVFDPSSAGQEIKYSTNGTSWTTANSGASANAIKMHGIGTGLSGSGATVGNILMQAGSTAHRTNQYGNAEIVFPRPFPRGVLSVVATHGHHAAYGYGDIQIAPTNPGKGNVSYPVASTRSFVYKFVGTNGAGLANRQHRVNWIALGW